jgi:hypothetical protein
MKNILKYTLFSSILGYFIFLAASCGDHYEPTPTVNKPIDIGYAEDYVYHSHIKFVSPCPQPVTQTIKVNCFKGTDSAACTVDSVVITNTSAGLIAKFNTGSSTTFEGGLMSRKIDFTFTCAIAESFTHIYTLVFYKDGIKVTEEDFTVTVSVTE